MADSYVLLSVDAVVDEQVMKPKLRDFELLN